MSNIYDLAKQFKRRYPMTVAWRIKAHAKVAERHLFSDEKIEYVFLGQKNSGSLDFVNTNIVVVTDRRIMLATKRLVFGYFFKSITLDMFNDLTVKRGLIWGRVIIDTVKEVVILTNISPSALTEIDENITKLILRKRKEENQEEQEKED